MGSERSHIYEGVVLSISENESIAYVLLTNEGQLEDGVMELSKFPQSPIIGQYFEIDTSKDEHWITLQELETWTQEEVDVSPEASSEYASLIDYSPLPSSEDTQQNV